MPKQTGSAVISLNCPRYYILLHSLVLSGALRVPAVLADLVGGDGEFQRISAENFPSCVTLYLYVC